MKTSRREAGTKTANVSLPKSAEDTEAAEERTEGSSSDDPRLCPQAPSSLQDLPADPRSSFPPGLAEGENGGTLGGL